MGCMACSCFKRSRRTPNSHSSLIQVAVEPPKVIIESKYTVNDILKADETPPSTQKAFMIFNCPICLRYLSHMLVTRCCNNYLCHLCAHELQNKELSFEVTCPHCKAQPLSLIDVDPQSIVKKYSDSPYGTFKAVEGQTNKWVPLLPIVAEDDFCEVPAHPLRSSTQLFIEESGSRRIMMYNTV